MSQIEQEIAKNRSKIHTDSYPMSIGEIINLYKDGELDIHPEFQRIYRWSDSQKSKLIESILLGIPLPSIFVAQRQDGVWDVVDGLQRLSTIFSFIGIFKDENEEILPPLELSETEYIPSLKDMKWDNTESIEKELPVELKRTFKREKIDIKIIQKESDDNAKYELFQRLNTGGSKLSDQEIRNCLLLMLNHDMYDWLKEISENTDFQACIPITDKQVDEQIYMEIALRFVIYRHFSPTRASGFSDLNLFITTEMKEVLFMEDFDRENEKIVFERTFELFNELLQEDSFKKFSHEQNKYKGPFSLSIFEVLAVGASSIEEVDNNLKNKIYELSKFLAEDDYFIDNTKYGTRSISRFQILTKYGKRLFSDED